MSSPISIERVPYGGWPNNLRLANAHVEVIVTLDVGPRILRYGPPGGRNVLGELTGDLGGTGEPGWRLRGGHRLWVAPEEPTRTYIPDNGPVLYEALAGDAVRVTTPADPIFRLQKSLELRLSPDGPGLELRHRIRNGADVPATFAVWALTVMAKEGTALVPLHRRERHPQLGAATAQDFAPAQTMALWPYFTFDDPRVTFGRQFLRIRQDPRRSSTKIGLQHRSGWAAYWNDGLLFAKSFGYVEGATYPDGGCNFECYTDPDILELESLSPLVTVAPGDEIIHDETWTLLTDVASPGDDEAIDRLLSPRLA